MRDGKYVLGFLGLGNIGGATYKLLQKRLSDRFTVSRALVRSLSKKREGFPQDILTTDPDRVLEDAEIDIVVEFLGGVEPAAAYMEKALQNGKSVVTANKAALSHGWNRLFKAARESGAGLYFEAACGAGIPVVAPLQGLLDANEVTDIIGILNGTTNFILDEMAQGRSYGEALSMAQAQGLAEADPTADVSGGDSANKLSILLSLASRAYVPMEAIYVEGVEKLQTADIRHGAELGLTLKLLAIGRLRSNGIEARVHPAFIAKDHPFTRVNGSYNAISLHGDAVQDLLFYGKGAGPYPTASGLVGDIVKAAAAPKGFHGPYVSAPQSPAINEDWESAYYIRLLLKNAQDAEEALAANGVRVVKAFQAEAEAVAVLTHPALESDMQKAVAALGRKAIRVESLIRVEVEGISVR